ncbi:MAG: GAF domain-containing protein [Anaerolineae bacterium]|nr:GAF domain-containing protein [Anaerolineae bacterium]
MSLWPKRLAARLALYFIVISVVVVGAVSGMTYLLVRGALERSTVERLEVIMDARATALKDWQLKYVNRLLAVVKEPDVLQAAGQLLTSEATDSGYQDAYDTLLKQLLLLRSSEVDFKEIFILKAVVGEVVISTDRLSEGDNYINDPYFISGINKTFIQGVELLPGAAQPVITIAVPIIDEQGSRIGVLAARVSLSGIEEIVNSSRGLGANGNAYLVNSTPAIVSATKLEPLPEGNTSLGINDALFRGLNGIALYDDYTGQPVIGAYQWLSSYGLALLIELPAKEVFAAAQQLALTVVLAGWATSIIFGVIIFMGLRHVTDLLHSVVSVAEKTLQGDFTEEVPVLSADEIGELAHIFNQIVAQLRTIQTDFEARVAARTAAIERKADYLSAAAEISRVVTSILDLKLLLSRVVNLVAEQYGVYHVGVYLMDEIAESVVLYAASSEEGQQMLSKGDYVKVGAQNMVGFVAQVGRGRVALDSDDDEFWSVLPELPGTRSEIGLPLIAQQKIIGVLDIHSSEPEFFSNADVPVLRMLADQIAVAVVNARLFNEREIALQRLQSLYGEEVQHGWGSRLRESAGYRYTPTSTTFLKVSEVSVPPKVPVPQVVDHNKLLVPLQLAGNVLGTLALQRDSELPWTIQEITFVENASQEIVQAMENARLLDATRNRAAQDRLLGEVATRLRRSMDPEIILRTTVQELGKVMDAEMVAIELTGSLGTLAEEDLILEE